MINYSSSVTIAQNINRRPDSISKNAITVVYKKENNINNMCTTYSIQSIANKSETSFVGNPRAVSTNSMVTNAALGILAAPILAKVAVRL